MSTEGRRLLAYLGLVLAALFWAGNAVLARAVAEEIGPFSLAFWRWAFALLILLPIGWRFVQPDIPVVRANLGRLFWLGLFSVGAYNTLLYIAAHTTTALNITLVNSTMPIALAILAWAMLGQRTSKLQALGFAVAAAGMLVIVARGDWQVFSGLAFAAGDLLMIVAVLIWGLYSVLLRKWAIRLHPVGLLTITMAVGVALLLPFYLWELATGNRFAWNSTTMVMFGYLAIFPSILSFLFWNLGIVVLGPSVTGMFIYLVPVFTAALAYTLLGEPLHAYHGMGGLLILCGLYLATTTRSATPLRSS